MYNKLYKFNYLKMVNLKIKVYYKLDKDKTKILFIKLKFKNVRLKYLKNNYK